MIHSESNQVPELFQTSARFQTSRPRHTQCGTVVDRLLDLSGPFKTKCWSAVIVPCSSQGAGEPSKLCCHPPAATADSSTATLDLETDTVRTGRSVCFCQTGDVDKEEAAVHAAVLCLLCGFALPPPSKPPQLLLLRSSVSRGYVQFQME